MMCYHQKELYYQLLSPFLETMMHHYNRVLLLLFQKLIFYYNQLLIPLLQKMIYHHNKLLTPLLQKLNRQWIILYKSYRRSLLYEPEVCYSFICIVLLLFAILIFCYTHTVSKLKTQMNEKAKTEAAMCGRLKNLLVLVSPGVKNYQAGASILNGTTSLRDLITFFEEGLVELEAQVGTIMDVVNSLEGVRVQQEQELETRKIEIYDLRQQLHAIKRDGTEINVNNTMPHSNIAPALHAATIRIVKAITSAFTFRFNVNVNEIQDDSIYYMSEAILSTFNEAIDSLYNSRTLEITEDAVCITEAIENAFTPSRVSPYSSAEHHHTVTVNQISNAMTYPILADDSFELVKDEELQNNDDLACMTPETVSEDGNDGVGGLTSGTTLYGNMQLEPVNNDFFVERNSDSENDNRRPEEAEVPADYVPDTGSIKQIKLPTSILRGIMLMGITWFLLYY